MAYTKEEAAAQIIRAGKALVEKGLVARTWGNISARISDTEFMITPSGKAYENLTPEDLVVCRIEDCSHEGDVKPSSEKGVHAAAYKLRGEVNFIIHTHQLYATSVGAMGRGLSGKMIEDTGVLGEQVVCAKYAISSTKSLAKNVAAAIKKYPKCNAFFMRFHGVLCLGADYDSAFSLSDTLESVCRQITEKKLRLSAEPKEGFPEAFDEEAVCAAIAEKNIDGCILFDSSVPAVEVSWKWSVIYSMIDDLAQMGGASFECIDTKTENPAEAIAQALEKKPLVFVRGMGAVVRAADVEEAEALRTVLDKNCVAALYCDAQGVREHLRFADAMLQRLVYEKKYSKLK